MSRDPQTVAREFCERHFAGLDLEKPLAALIKRERQEAEARGFRECREKAMAKARWAHDNLSADRLTGISAVVHIASCITSAIATLEPGEPAPK